VSAPAAAVTAATEAAATAAAVTAATEAAVIAAVVPPVIPVVVRILGVIVNGRGVVELNIAGRLADDARAAPVADLICRGSRRCGSDRYRGSARR
jgi:hypothetical protein